MVTVPSLALATVTVRASPSGSVSLASTLMLMVPLSSSVEAVSGLAVGALFTAVLTVTVTLAEAIPPLPSLIE